MKRAIAVFALLLACGACVDQPTEPSRARPPEAPSLLLGVSRTWTGAVSTDWNTSGNWSPSGVPAVQDSVSVPLSAPLQPVLSSNVSIGQVTVQDSATITLGAFDLTASRNVIAGINGGIVGPTGRLILTGTAATLQGRVPRLRVTGTYSLTGNVRATMVDVSQGRITDTGWRLDAVAP